MLKKNIVNCTLLYIYSFSKVEYGKNKSKDHDNDGKTCFIIINTILNLLSTMGYTLITGISL